MSVLIYTENWDGKFKKLSFELVSYASAIAEKMNGPVVVLSIGNVADEELKKLGAYGASKILSVNDQRLTHLVNQPYASIIAQAAAKEQSKVVLFAHNNTGKALAPRVAVKCKAGMAAAVTAAPSSIDPFVVRKKVRCKLINSRFIMPHHTIKPLTPPLSERSSLHLIPSNLLIAIRNRQG